MQCNIHYLLGNPVCYRDPRTDGLPEEFFGGDLVRHYSEAGIQVMSINTLSQQITITVYQSKVHAPGINTNAPDMISLAHRLPESVLHLIKQGKKIPVHMVSHPHLTVWKAVHLFQFQRNSGDSLPCGK